jgi:predicted kinase
MPASGKTTVARALADELRVPLVTKDGIKERLYDELGTGDIAWSRQLGGAAYALLFEFCRELLAAGLSVAAEANFFAGSQEGQVAALPPHRLVQIVCTAPLDVLLERYAGRTRHPATSTTSVRVSSASGSKRGCMLPWRSAASCSRSTPRTRPTSRGSLLAFRLRPAPPGARRRSARASSGPRPGSRPAPRSSPACARRSRPASSCGRRRRPARRRPSPA